jgi:hypothetical protein
VYICDYCVWLHTKSWTSGDFVVVIYLITSDIWNCSHTNILTLGTFLRQYLVVIRKRHSKTEHYHLTFKHTGYYVCYSRTLIVHVIRGYFFSYRIFITLLQTVSRGYYHSTKYSRCLKRNLYSSLIHLCKKYRSIYYYVWTDYIYYKTVCLYLFNTYKVHVQLVLLIPLIAVHLCQKVKKKTFAFTYFYSEKLNGSIWDTYILFYISEKKTHIV